MITLKKKFSDLDSLVYNKKVLLRIDLNLPIFNGEVTDFTRLEKILPTINYLLKNNAKIIILSHFGRPDGLKDTNFSLNIILEKIKNILDHKIFFIQENLKTIKKDKIDKALLNNKIVLLENLRFYSEEINNDEIFSKKLASFGDIYVNECFSTSHRKHSSIVGIPKFLPSFPGTLLENEVSTLKNLITIDSETSSVAVFGGSKVSTKIKILEFYLNKFKKVLIGGAMANTFIAAMDNVIGTSLYEKSMIKVAKDFLKNFQDEIVLPKDLIVEDKNKKISVKTISNVKKDEKILDIGPQARMEFYNYVINCSHLLWNGPLGYYEKKPFNEGTNFVIKAVKNNKNKNFFSVAGGGDTISVVKQAGASKHFSFISTGGGAFLEFIQGHGLPGLDSLNE
ncbi:MAG: phosphoglycerate kinase [Alphaproteobacteria bacterium]